jgi:hypothetical protein
LSYMKTGRALTFVNQVTRHTEMEGALPFADWSTFWKELEDRFLPLDESEEAMNLLETDKYFQGRRTVDDYCDQFQDLIDHAKYTDGKQIVMKFRKGLENTVADAVATLKEGRPADNDMQGWIKAAKDIARQRFRNEAFNTSVRKDRVISKPPNAPFTRNHTYLRPPFLSKETPTITAPKPILPILTKPSPSTEGNSVMTKPKQEGPVPMEVDASRQRGRFPITCHRCGQVGHYQNQCPRRYDVRYMSSTELEDCLQEQLAIEDVAEAMSHGEPDEAGPEPEEKEGKEDFLQGDE